MRGISGGVVDDETLREVALIMAAGQLSMARGYFARRPQRLSLGPRGGTETTIERGLRHLRSACRWLALAAGL